MWDFSIGRALGLMAQTAPFILLRIAVYFGIAVGYVLATGVGAGAGYTFGLFGDEEFRTTSSVWGGLIGLGLFSAALHWAREYILYMVKAGHIAVLVELLDGKPLPAGQSQVAHATAVVKERFVQANVLFAIDQLVKGVIRAITGLARGILGILPIPGGKQLADIIHGFLRVAVGFIDEVILAYAIRTRSANPWDSARTALVLYGQNYKTLLKNAAWLAVIVYGLSIVVFVIMLAPAALVVYLMPGAWAAGGFIFALIFAWSVKAALLEPFAITCLMEVYFKTIEGQTPDPEWEAKLEQLSGKFRELKARALGAGRQQPEAGSSDLRRA